MRLFNNRSVLSALFVGLVLSAVAWAQQLVNQGKPGTQGAWPVACVSGCSGGGGGGGGFPDGGIATFPVRCLASSPNAFTSLGLTAASVPAAPAVARVYIRLCLTLEATGVPQVKCRTDGTDPAFGTSPGEVLAPGDCVTYTLSGASNVRCIANGASTPVSTYECIP